MIVIIKNYGATSDNGPGRGRAAGGVTRQVTPPGQSSVRARTRPASGFFAAQIIRILIVYLRYRIADANASNFFCSRIRAGTQA